MKRKRATNTRLFRLKQPVPGSNSPLSDQTSAVGGAAWAAASCDAHQLLRELTAAGLSVRAGQFGVRSQPLGGGRLGLLTEDSGETLDGKCLRTLCPFVYNPHLWLRGANAWTEVKSQQPSRLVSVSLARFRSLDMHRLLHCTDSLSPCSHTHTHSHSLPPL